MSNKYIFFWAFLILTFSQKIFDPVYIGYIIAYGVLLFGVHIYGCGPKSFEYQAYGALVLGLILLSIALLQAFIHDYPMRDIVRDLGALLSFYIGYSTLPRLFNSYNSDWRLSAMKSVSAVGMIVILMTFVGAIQAFAADANAYLWRGEYVPYAHTWLPYIFVINISLAQIKHPSHIHYVSRAMLCLIGTLASLSRTDLALELIFIMVLATINLRTIISNHRMRRFIFLSGAVILLLTPYILRLTVVQERIDVGLDENDPSLAWRFMENESFLDEYMSANWFIQLFGFGLGSRISLPEGILDFDGNDSIPHLHNSYFTIAMKFGVIGLVVLFFAIYKAIRNWWKSRPIDQGKISAAALWILFFVLGKAITLQGLSEWSHLFFFGFGCALVFKPPKAQLKLTPFSPAQ